MSWLSSHPQGTGTAAISASTGVVTRRYFTPFGVLLATTTSGSGTATWSGTRGFVGGTANATTGLTNLGAWESDPALPAFLSPDPVLNTSDQQDFDPYDYSENNPVIHSDPTGLSEGGDNPYPYGQDASTNCESDNAGQGANGAGDNVGNYYAPGAGGTVAPGTGMLPPAQRYAYQEYAANNEGPVSFLELSAPDTYCNSGAASGSGCGKSLSLQLLEDWFGIAAPSTMVMQMAGSDPADAVLLSDGSIGMALRADEDLSDLDTAQDVTSAVPGQLLRGQEFEADTLRELGLTKNTASVPGGSIPYSMADGDIWEVKDVKYQTMTNRFRNYIATGMPVNLVVNPETVVSVPLRRRSSGLAGKFWCAKDRACLTGVRDDGFAISVDGFRCCSRRSGASFRDP